MQRDETLFDQILEMAKDTIRDIPENQVKTNNISARKRISFLNKNFNTAVFSNYNRVSSIDFTAAQADNPMHLSYALGSYRDRF
jgi:hypothetical protein